jgi:hypothetical protein
LAGRRLIVTSAFAAAIDALFADPNLAAEALCRAGGADPGIPVRVIVRRPDRIGDFGETRIASETETFDVRTSEIAKPVEGDTLEIDGIRYVIQGEPLRDSERLIWTIEARPRADLG